MAVKIIRRPSEDRNLMSRDWLKDFHAFSMSSYSDPGLGPLLVLNEARVTPNNGFGAHSHREFEIFSYVVSGQLEHKDSMNNVEILKRGDIQLTSAGTGITHAEGAYGSKEVHFLQIWAKPNLPEAEKRDTWCRVVASVDSEGVQKDDREGKGPTPVQAHLTLYATLLTDGKSLTQKIANTKGYVMVVQSSGFNKKAATGATIKVRGASGAQVQLREGDGAFLHFDQGGGDLIVDNVGDRTAEVLLFDVEE
ncbi:RmlC-like cupin domain-containing protein [Mycena filopes]|nr:RmlC-like cupin domain-containing protein [Mycena filopes]